MVLACRSVERGQHAADEIREQARQEKEKEGQQGQELSLEVSNLLPVV